MRRIARAIWVPISAAVALIGACIAGQPVAASLFNGFSTQGAGEQRVIDFTNVDYAFSNSVGPPTAGWRRSPLPALWSEADLLSGKAPGRTVWGRLRFDRSAVGAANLGLFTEENRDRLMLWVNGVEVMRNFSDRRNVSLYWNTPYFVSLDPRLLKPGVNEIDWRVESIVNLSLGSVRLGSAEALSRLYNSRYFLRISGPLAANLVMALAGAGALIIWLNRRRETELLFLALSTLLWWVRNYHFFGHDVAIPESWLVPITIYSIYFANAASLSFCVLFLKPPRWKGVVAGLWLVGAVTSLARLVVGPTFNEAWINLATLAGDAFVVGLILVTWRKTRSVEHLTLGVILFLAVAATVFDIGRIPSVHWWSGFGFYFQPYIGCALTLAFLASFGRRSVGAFHALEDMNRTLETHVAEVRRELAVSEARRRELEVAKAVASERERLMREMHDGVGSSLVTALAAAERDGKGAADTLRQALLSLKITVDSLEPVEGDLVALIANLRHRLTPDLKRAGVTVRWRAEPCPPLPWLDPPKALSILRIFQEAIGNALTHSGAREIEIGCREDLEGLVAWVADDGCGFSQALSKPAGRGLANMRTRAEALEGLFRCEPGPAGGTRVSIWMPLVRTARTPAG